MEPTAPDLPGWAVLELAGGGRVAGQIIETVVAGQPCLRVSLNGFVTIHPPGSWTQLTPTSREVAEIIGGHPEATVSYAPPELRRGHAEVLAEQPAGPEAGATR